MIKTFRDAEIQVEDLRDKLNRLKSSNAGGVDVNEVNVLINQAIRRIKFPTPVFEQSNIFEEVIIRRGILGKSQPNLIIESLGSDSTKSRLTKLTDISRVDLDVNVIYDGSAFSQDDVTLNGLKFSLVAAATDAITFFYWDLLGAGDTAVTRLLILNGSGMLYPGTDSTQDFGLTGTRWRVGYFDDIQLTNPLGVTYGGTGLATLSSGYTLQGNGTGSVSLVNGVDESDTYLISFSVTTDDINYKDHSGSNASMTVVVGVSVLSSKSLVFSKGVLTSAT